MARRFFIINAFETGVLCGCFKLFEKNRVDTWPLDTLNTPFAATDCPGHFVQGQTDTALLFQPDQYVGAFLKPLAGFTRSSRKIEENEKSG
ncbi:hypothetical protein [Nitratidesulfovibrio liaohensis]|uniref:Uncharacterized protein n=1 Tax=Nitratidesulfovibrio liaohensis TaxID=2604158 RepID=A0ABY9R6D7_9BACT|nr:hypothetical protein [Nitratidesulfovibrio liaohensis]WMW66702.1 hypothetical protein KPS_001314 [Nitratidesulfovibrio liaohensis]